MNEEFICQARVVWRGKELHLNRIVAQIDLDEIIPPHMLMREEPSVVSLNELSDRNERRRRFVDLISAEFAHSLTEALFKMPDDRV